jgi:sugar lactone lactonase YvrE
VQDHNGFYWLGSQHGLYRYDGNELKNFRAIPDQPDSLSADWITSLLVDQQGYIWVGTRYAGLNRFNPDTERFERITTAEGLDGSRLNIAKIYQDSLGTLWVSAYGEGLLAWSEAQQQLIRSTTFHLSKFSNRMGIQLEELVSNQLEDLPTNPVFPGTVQLTPGGKLIVLMRDAGVTGGYPRILHLTEEGQSKLAQKRVGDPIRFQLLETITG